MANDRTNSGSPGAELPELTRQVRPLNESEAPRTLANKLVPVVDKIRNLFTRFGIRPYRVFLVHLEWGGSRSGEGAQPREISRLELLPTPQVMDMTGTSEVLRPLGLSEEGGVSINQISAKYTEDDLLGRTPDLVDPTLPRTNARRIEFYWEIVENRTSDPRPARRRYVPSGVPTLTRDGFQWRISLTKQDLDAGRTGSFNPRTN